MVGRVLYPPSTVARERRNSFRPHQHIVGKDPSHPRRLPQHQGGGRKRVANIEQRRTPFLYRPTLPQKKKLKKR